MSEKILFIFTGGTIDKSYDPVSQDFQPNEQSSIPAFLNDTISPYFEASYETLFMKDSRDFTQEDVNHILFAVRKTSHSKIIITHGTDTMPDTAQFLMKELDDDPGKTIVLTGSFVPLRQFATSDAGYNLGFASAAVQTLPPGIYLCMNGHVFEAGGARKNIKRSRFETGKS